MNRSFLACLLVAVAIVSPSPSHALVDVETDTFVLKINGSGRLFPLYQRLYPTPLAPAHTEALSVQRVRTELGVSLWDTVYFGVAYDIIGVVGSLNATFGQQLTLTSVDSLRIADIKGTIDSGNEHRLSQNLDRLVLTVDLPWASLSVGRQAIGHGSARIIAPTDIFGPFSPASLDSEYKPGVDAATLTVPLGDAFEVEAIGIGHADGLSSGIYLLRLAVSLPLFDISTYAGTSYQEPTVGIDVAATIGGTGVYGEVLVRSQENDRLGVRATVGAHHRLPIGLSGILELHYSTIGGAKPSDYAEVLSRAEVARGEMFLLGRAYTATSLNYELSPLVNIGMLWIQNLTDGSALVGPSLAWNFDDNVAIGLGMLLGLGQRPTFSLTPPNIVFRQEFGAAPNVFYGELRFYY